MGLAFQVLIFTITFLNLYTASNLSKEVPNDENKKKIINDILEKYNDTGKSGRSNNDTRRQHPEDDEDEAKYSSSDELPNFKKEWKATYWMKKQYEIMNRNKNNSFLITTVDPDAVNMIAARPWGVRCGDPSMHDMPWGTCMLAMECEPEFRIWRGDYFCGRTQFICCAIEETSYDLYKGFDASFGSSFETDTDERNERDRHESMNNKNKNSEKKRRQKDRLERKRVMKRKIKEIIKQVKKLLDSIYNDGTKEKRKKTKQMKQFIKELKAQYKKDRQAMKDIHEIEFIKIDAKLRERLEEIRLINVNFMKNATFRKIILNGTLTLSGARMLVEAYPELESYFGMRRSMSPSKRDYTDYDVEYGLLYY